MLTAYEEVLKRRLQERGRTDGIKTLPFPAQYVDGLLDMLYGCMPEKFRKSLGEKPAVVKHLAEEGVIASST